MLMATETCARPEPHERSRIWHARAGDLLEQALGQFRDGEDAIPAVGAALAALRIAVGELAEDALDFMFPEADRCICPPDLRRRGGFCGGCPAHASA